MGFWDTVTQEWKYRLLMFVSPAVLSMLIMFINAPAPFMIEPQVVPLDITRYEPLEGVFAPNLALQAVIAVGQDVLRSPEAMFASPDGKVYTIDDRAILYQIKSLRGSSEYAVEQVHAFGQANGRNLGGEFRSDGSLVLCNVPRGLFLFNLTTKKMTLLTDTVTVEEGKPPCQQLMSYFRIRKSRSTLKTPTLTSWKIRLRCNPEQTPISASFSLFGSLLCLFTVNKCT